MTCKFQSLEIGRDACIVGQLLQVQVRGQVLELVAINVVTEKNSTWP